MKDDYGRTIDYIRVSVTDRCNLRCTYCMPKGGIKTVPHTSILSFDEILRVVRILAGAGISKVKITGGEPLARKDLPVLIKAMKAIQGIEQVTLTTNGVLLADQMEKLAAAGINGINLSLDTLNPVIYQQITRRGEFDRAMKGLQAALLYPDIPLKVNCVPIGLEGQDVIGLAELARKYPIHVRYIEVMPIGYGTEYQMESEAEILGQLKDQYGAYERFTKVLGNGPGHYYTFNGFLGKIGFISAVTHQFCDQCNRIRLTSQGFLKTCLQYETGCDLRELLRSGADDALMLGYIKAAVARKPQGHRFGGQVLEQGETRTMSQIGG